MIVKRYHSKQNIWDGGEKERRLEKKKKRKKRRNA